MSMLKEKGKLIKVSQVLLFIMGILYLLESIFIRGMFSNVYLLLGVGIFGLIAAAVSLIKKEYKLLILDFAICLGCFIIFNILINL